MFMLNKLFRKIKCEVWNPSLMSPHVVVELFMNLFKPAKKCIGVLAII